MAFLSFVTENTTPADVWKLHAGLETAFPKLPGNVFDADSSLSEIQKSLIAAYFAAHYARKRGRADDVSFAVAAVQGAFHQTVDVAILDKLLDDPETADSEEKLGPILAFARKLAVEPYKLMQRDADAIYQVGWSEQTLTDAVFLCSSLVFFLSVMLGHGVSTSAISEH